MDPENNLNPPATPASAGAASGPPLGIAADIYPTPRGSSGPPPGSTPPAATPVTPAPQQPAEPQKPAKPPKTGRERWGSILSTVLLFALAPIIALSITAFAFQSYQVDGQSMETTLQNNDRLIVNKIPRTVSRVTHHSYVPKRGQIVIFNQAGLFESGATQEKQLIKRVIGLPGERVVVKDGTVTVYNKSSPNGFNPDTTGKYKITAPSTPGDVDVVLRPNEIFVCGDNRGNSEDSREFGPVSVQRIVGKLTFRILPLSKAQKF